MRICVQLKSQRAILYGYFIVNYSIGIATTCVHCNDYIQINNKFDFVKNIDCNGNNIYKYALKHARFVKDDNEFRILYKKRYRIFCHKCNPDLEENKDNAVRCNIEPCGNMEVEEGEDPDVYVCGQHKRCVLCLRSAEFGFGIKSCKNCLKYYCSDDEPNLRYDSLCSSCLQRQKLMKRCYQLSQIIPYFHEKEHQYIIEILVEYAMGYSIICAGCHRKEIVLEPDGFDSPGLNYYMDGETMGYGYWHQEIHWTLCQGGQEIIGATLIGDKYYKIFCGHCTNTERNDPRGHFEDEWHGVNRLINCYWCGEFCTQIDDCQDCEYYHCSHCPCNDKDNPICMKCGYRGKHIWDCKCIGLYYFDLGQYDNDEYYSKHIKSYSLC